MSFLTQATAVLCITEAVALMLLWHRVAVQRQDYAILHERLDDVDNAVRGTLGVLGYRTGGLHALLENHDHKLVAPTALCPICGQRDFACNLTPRQIGGDNPELMQPVHEACWTPDMCPHCNETPEPKGD